MAARQDIDTALRAIFPADIAGLILPYTAHTDAEKIRTAIDALPEVGFDTRTDDIVPLRKRGRDGLRSSAIVPARYMRCAGRPYPCVIIPNKHDLVFVDGETADAYTVHLMYEGSHMCTFDYTIKTLACMVRDGDCFGLFGPIMAAASAAW